MVDNFPNVKICGLTRPEDAAAAGRAGAWALGVILARESPRYVTLEQAGKILAAAPEGIEKVGVFVNEPPEAVAAAVRASGMTAVQLHGEETPGQCRQIADLTGAIVIKAIRAKDPQRLAQSVALFDTGLILLDTYSQESRGGTGKTFDWSLAALLPEETRSGRLILSGGLNAGNVLEALDAVGPYAVDVSSGIESAPGIKDPGEMERLFDILKEMRR